ncbi:MAG: PIN domain-containing protein [Chloroflexi bacterium]|nr:MAG: PIN domain-containing protein [Chloroflexota bacterium]
MAEPIRYLLDTSALLAHFRQEEGWESVQSLFEREDAQLIIASPTLTELGRRLISLGATEAEVTETVTRYQLLFHEVVPIDAAIALAAFVIGQNSARRLPLVDALIDGAAQARSAILVHRDEHLTTIPAALLRQQTLNSPASN